MWHVYNNSVTRCFIFVGLNCEHQAPLTLCNPRWFNQWWVSLRQGSNTVKLGPMQYMKCRWLWLGFVTDGPPKWPHVYLAHTMSFLNYDAHLWQSWRFSHWSQIHRFPETIISQQWEQACCRWTMIKFLFIGRIVFPSCDKKRSRKKVNCQINRK